MQGPQCRNTIRVAKDLALSFHTAITSKYYGADYAVDTASLSAPAHPCACGISESIHVTSRFVGNVVGQSRSPLARIPALRGIRASMHIIACIEDPTVIKKILAHLERKAASAGTGLLADVRAPPQTGLFD